MPPPPSPILPPPPKSHSTNCNSSPTRPPCCHDVPAWKGGARCRDVGGSPPCRRAWVYDRGASNEAAAASGDPPRRRWRGAVHRRRRHRRRCLNRHHKSWEVGRCACPSGGLCGGRCRGCPLRTGGRGGVRCGRCGGRPTVAAACRRVHQHRRLVHLRAAAVSRRWRRRRPDVPCHAVARMGGGRGRRAARWRRRRRRRRGGLVLRAVGVPARPRL